MRSYNEKDYFNKSSNWNKEGSGQNFPRSFNRSSSNNKHENLWLMIPRKFRSNDYAKEYSLFLKEHLEKVTEFLRNVEGFNKMMANEINIYSKDRNLIEKTPNVKGFNDLVLHPAVYENVQIMKYNEMTPIQRKVLPLIMQGENIIGCAQTGSGKTVAFLLPIINNMLLLGPEHDPSQIRSFTPTTLILSPTRELTEQTYKVCRLLTENTGISCAKIYGGAPHIDQLKEMNGGADILIATPGRLLDFLKKDTIKLDYIKYFILDEADRMLDMGFEKQINEIVFRYNMPDKSSRLSLLFSATFSREVYSSADAYIKNYLIATNNIQSNEFTFNENVIQRFIEVDDKNKDVELHKLLQNIKGTTIGKFYLILFSKFLWRKNIVLIYSLIHLTKLTIIALEFTVTNHRMKEIMLLKCLIREKFLYL